MGADASTTAATPPPPTTAPSPAATPVAPAGTISPNDLGNNVATPSMMALPVQPANTGGNGPLVDMSNAHKFYTISVALRETYDDNVNTAQTGKITSFETNISPSILVDFPQENNDFSAVYTFGATYYSDSGGTGSDVQYTHQFNAQLRHDFSTRFTLSASDAFRDSTEPNLFGTTGTPYRNGENMSNAFSTGFSAQWTPTWATQTTYANTLVHYVDDVISHDQDNMENTASQTFIAALVPKVSATFGGIFDTVSYDHVSRGYTSYTGFVGTNWQALPNVSLNLRVGGSLTQTDSVDGGQSSGLQASPYVDMSGSWQIGKRSSLTGDYSHEVTPTDQIGANGQESDRVSVNFSYDVTERLNTHLQLVYTYSTISGGFISSSGLQSYNETDYAVDAGASYNFVKYLNLTLDILESGVSSEISGRDYSRSQVTLGVRGTY